MSRVRFVEQLSDKLVRVDINEAGQLIEIYEKTDGTRYTVEHIEIC